ncbi:MAG: hypothetical protein KIT84_41920 [Labilithrix sp.]|nr:hypothetical protein [Labilithrix sp.]MCW5817632.1 hypothetical protein [Labilithrix sp.]
MTDPDELRQADVSVLRSVGSELDDVYLDSVAAGAGLTELLARARADV